jgi:hypothetical protein
MIDKIPEVLEQKAIKIQFDVKRTGIYRLLQKIKLIEEKKTYEIKPLTLGSLMRISKEVEGISDELFNQKDDNLMAANIKAMGAHSEALARVIAIGLSGRKGEPSTRIVNDVLNNFTPSDMMKVLNIILKQMNVMGFMSSIISIKGMSLVNPEEIIAPADSTLGK